MLSYLQIRRIYRWTMTVFLSLMILAMSAKRAKGQVYAIGGGASTLYNTQGGSVSYAQGAYTMDFGAGLMDGQFGAGGAIERHFPWGAAILGNSTMSFHLPTDLFAGGRSVYMTGVGLNVISEDRQAQLFVGAASNYFLSPLFDGAVPQKGAAIGVLHGKLSDHWSFTDNVLLTSKATWMEGFEWAPSRQTALAASAGLAEIGANSANRYGAVSARLNRRVFDLRAEYVAYGKTTQLYDISTIQNSEPIKDNFDFTFHPSYKHNFALSLGRQNIVVFPDQTVIGNEQGNISTVNTLSAGYTLAKTNLAAAFFDSKYLGREGTGESFSVARNITQLIAVQGSYSTSHSHGYGTQKVYSAGIAENITPQWSFQETVNDMDGHVEATGGGSYYNNRFSIRVQDSLNYIATNTQKPFQSSYLFSGSVNFLSKLKASFSTNIDAFGHRYYTVGGNYLSYGQQMFGGPPARDVGDYLVHGHVIGTDQKPVEGIALLIDKKLLFTDSDGYFEVRESKRRTHTFNVSIEQSTNVFLYEVVSGPQTVVSTADGDSDSGITIVLKRLMKMKGM